MQWEARLTGTIRTLRRVSDDTIQDQIAGHPCDVDSLVAEGQAKAAPTSFALSLCLCALMDDTRASCDQVGRMRSSSGWTTFS